LAEKAQAKAGADTGGDGFTDAANAGAEDADVVHLHLHGQIGRRLVVFAHRIRYYKPFVFL
jgi:diadenosine tetraphosphate (Ap4A) HIT family hydrolase